MCDPRDLNRRSASAVGGPRDHRHGHTPRSVPGGSTMHCSGEHTFISPSFFSQESWVCASLFLALLPRYVSLYSFICFYLFTTCLCKRMFCENSSTSSLSPSSEKDRRSIEPFLWGEEPRGGLPISESGHWIWWERKKIGLARLNSLHLIHLRAQPLLRLSGSVAGAARTLVKTPSSKRVPPWCGQSACFTPSQTIA